MKKFVALLSCLWITASALDAAVYCDMSATDLIRCSLSAKHHNRVLVQGGRVKKVIFPEGEITVRIEEESGQLFINALSFNPPVTTISLVTEDGEVQDIELSFATIPSEVIVLRKSNLLIVPNGIGPIACARPCFEYDGLSVLDNILDGSVPEGFIAFDEEDDPFKVKQGIKARKIGKLVGSEEVIYLFEIANTSTWSVKIHQRDFDFCNGLWAYLGCEKIAPKKKTMAIVSVRKA